MRLRTSPAAALPVPVLPAVPLHPITIVNRHLGAQSVKFCVHGASLMSLISCSARASRVLTSPSDVGFALATPAITLTADFPATVPRQGLKRLFQQRQFAMVDKLQA